MYLLHIGVFILFLFFWDPNHAQACLPPSIPGLNVKQRLIWPEKESKNVPINAQVVVSYTLRHKSFGLPYRELQELKLRAVGGQEVDATALFLNAKRWEITHYPSFAIIPKRLLRKNTKYEVLARVVSDDCGPRTGPCFNDDKSYGVISIFTTGSQVDRKVSIAQKIESSTKLEYFPGICSEEQKKRGCCEPSFKTSSFSLELKSRESDVAHFNVYVVEPNKKVQLILERYRVFGERTRVKGSHICSGFITDNLRFEGKKAYGRTRLILRAVDVAGNESKDSETVTLISRCNDTPEREGQGCSCALGGAKNAGGSGRVWWLALSLCLFGAWCRRKRAYRRKVRSGRV